MLKIMDGPDVAALLNELTTSAGREDPYPCYERLRTISPVVRAGDGALVVTHYADCTTAVRDPRLGQLPPDALAMAGYPDWAEHPALRQMFTSLLMLNPPDHTRLRRLVSGTFTARRVEALRPAITRMVNDLLDGMSGAADFVTAFPLPVNVIGELLGVPLADRARFQTLVRDWTQVLESLNPGALRRADAAATTIRDYLAHLAADRRREPGTDLLSALVAQQASHQLSEDELLTTAALLFAAGFETTTNLLTNSLVALLGNPGQLRLLREQPDLTRPAVEELLRFDSPVQIVSRITTRTRRTRRPHRGGRRTCRRLPRRRQPRPGALHRPAPPRPRPRGQRTPILRRRQPLLPRGAARPARSPARPARPAPPLPPALAIRRAATPRQPEHPRIHPAPRRRQLTRKPRVSLKRPSGGTHSIPHHPARRSPRRPVHPPRPGRPPGDAPRIPARLAPPRQRAGPRPSQPQKRTPPLPEKCTSRY